MFQIEGVNLSVIYILCFVPIFVRWAIFYWNHKVWLQFHWG